MGGTASLRNLAIFVIFLATFGDNLATFPTNLATLKI